MSEPCRRLSWFGIIFWCYCSSSWSSCAPVGMSSDVHWSHGFVCYNWGMMGDSHIVFSMRRHLIEVQPSIVQRIAVHAQRPELRKPPLILQTLNLHDLGSCIQHCFWVSLSQNLLKCCIIVGWASVLQLSPSHQSSNSSCHPSTIQNNHKSCHNVIDSMLARVFLRNCGATKWLNLLSTYRGLNLKPRTGLSLA